MPRGAGWLSRLCAWSARLPPPFRGPIRVEIDVEPAGERWSRHVGRHAMRSRLWWQDGLLYEQLGAVTFAFRLAVDDGRLRWTVQRVRALGVPLPPGLFQ